MKKEADSRTRPSSSRLLTEPGRPLMCLRLWFTRLGVTIHRCDSGALTDVRFGARYRRSCLRMKTRS
jgi:hypothetical protein